MAPMGARSTDREAAPALRDRMSRRARTARARYDASWAAEVGRELKALDFVNWITMFGASLLWSALPLIILLSSLANERVDDEISRHIGLNSQGAQIVHSLFRGTPAHAVEPILTGLVFSFAGVIAVVSSMQVMYERIFGLEERGRSNLPRGIAWAALLVAIVVVDDVIRAPVRRAMGPVVPDVIGLVTTTLFFWWSMHFLLAGRATWRSLVRPAVATGLL